MMKFDAKRRDDTHRRRHRLSVRDVRPHINVTRNAKDTARQPSVFLRIRPNKMRLPSVLSSVDPTWCRLPVNVERPDTHTGGQFPLRSQCTYPPSSVFVCVWADQVRKSVVKQTHRHTEKQADKQTDSQKEFSHPSLSYWSLIDSKELRWAALIVLRAAAKPTTEKKCAISWQRLSSSFSSSLHV